MSDKMQVKLYTVIDLRALPYPAFPNNYRTHPWCEGRAEDQDQTADDGQSELQPECNETDCFLIPRACTQGGLFGIRGRGLGRGCRRPEGPSCMNEDREPRGGG